MIGKKTLFFGALTVIIVVMGYLISRVVMSPSKVIQNFTSVGSNLIYDNSNIWAIDYASAKMVEFDVGGTKITELPTGYMPQSAIAFGAYAWVCNYGDGTVSEILETNGTSTTSLTGKGPSCCAFDGTNIWVTNYLDGTCTVINQTGGAVKTVNVGNSPSCCLFDGSNMWITLQSTGQVVMVDIGDFSIKNIFTVGTQPIRMTYTSHYVFVLNSDSTISKVNSQGVQATLTLNTPVCTDIVSDKSNLWVCQAGGTIVCYDITGKLISNFASGLIPNSIMLMGDNIAILDNKTTNMLRIFTKTTGTVLASINL